MRMEKGYLHWKADIIYERNLIETDLARLTKLDKPEFVGKETLEASLAKGFKKQLVTLVIDSEIAPAHSGDSFYVSKSESLIGTVTSGAYVHRVNKNITFVKTEFAEIGTKLNIDILEQQYPTEITERCLYVSEYKLVRS